MSSETTDTNSMPQLAVDACLLSSVIKSTIEGLGMCGIEPKAVGATCFSASRNPMSIIVGLVGRTSGSITLNMTEKGMLFLVSKLLCEEFDTVDEDTIDGIMEIGNMVAGRMKVNLEGTEYQVSNVSLPSIIFGPGFQVLYSRGINTVGVEFELEDMPFSLLNDRFFTATVSLLRGAGV
jgi:CheY-specific phosphatase CheX